LIPKILLVWSAALLALTVQGEPTRMEPRHAGCSGFSKEQKHRSPRLSWQFRSCTTVTGQKEVQVRFRNRSNEPIHFEFRLWTEPLMSCRTQAPPSARGVRHLRANAAEEWPYTTLQLEPAAGFSGRIWVCVKEAA
jgi:hypothetical protein